FTTCNMLSRVAHCTTHSSVDERPIACAKLRGAEMTSADGSSDRWTGRRQLRAAALLAGGGVRVLVPWLCAFPVGTGEFALVLEFGNPVRVVSTPGLGFKYPYQSVRTLDGRLFAFSATSTEYLTLEKTPIVAASTVVWRISDAKKFFQTVFDRAGAESRLGDILFSELGAAIGRSPLATFVSMDAATYR